MKTNTEATIYTFEDLMSKFKRHESDSGSPEVQIIKLSFKIAYLSRHLNEYKKDNAAKRALIIIVNERKSLIKYLYRTKPEICKKIAEAIGIRGKW